MITTSNLSNYYFRRDLQWLHTTSLLINLSCVAVQCISLGQVIWLALQYHSGTPVDSAEIQAVIIAICPGHI